MKHSGRHSARETVAAAIAAGSTVVAAAETAGVGRVTVHRWLQEAEFRQRIAELRREMTGRAIGRLADRMAKAVDVLAEVLESPIATARLKAAIALLELGLRAVTLADVQARVEAIEERLSHASDPRPIDETGNSAS